MSTTASTGHTFVVDPFCARQFDEASKKTPFINCTIADFEDKVNELAGSEPQLHEGYAPFCKHLFVPNFVGAKVNVLPITPENESLVKNSQSIAPSIDIAAVLLTTRCVWYGIWLWSSYALATALALRRNSLCSRAGSHRRPSPLCPQPSTLTSFFILASRSAKKMRPWEKILAPMHRGVLCQSKRKMSVRNHATTSFSHWHSPASMSTCHAAQLLRLMLLLGRLQYERRIRATDAAHHRDAQRAWQGSRG